MKRMLSAPRSLVGGVISAVTKNTHRPGSFLDKDSVQLSLKLISRDDCGQVCLNDAPISIRHRKLVLRECTISKEDLLYLVSILATSKLTSIRFDQILMRELTQLGKVELPKNTTLDSLTIRNWDSAGLLNEEFSRKICSHSFDKKKYEELIRQNTEVIELFLTMAEYKNISIVGTLFSSSLLTSIPDKINPANIKKLELVRTNLKIDDLSKLSARLPSFKQLNTLNLSENHLCQHQSEIRIWSGFFRTLKSLPKLESLNLSLNFLQQIHCIALCEFLETNPPLQALDVSRNMFIDSGIEQIMQSILRNTNLTSLRLTSNKSSWMNAETICNLVLMNPALRELHLGRIDLSTILIENQNTKQAFGSLKYYDLAFPKIYLFENLRCGHFVYSTENRCNLTGDGKKPCKAIFLPENNSPLKAEDRAVFCYLVLKFLGELDEKFVQLNDRKFIGKLFLMDQDSLGKADYVCELIKSLKIQNLREKHSINFIDSTGHVVTQIGYIDQHIKHKIQSLNSGILLQLALKDFYRNCGEEELWLKHNIICKDIYSAEQTKSPLATLPAEILVLIGFYLGFGVNHSGKNPEAMVIDQTPEEIEIMGVESQS